ncbi:peptidase inhibitor family I36 protein [Streptomyces sp. NPDC047022]|uniref:peptidase inhibitor family I36 protein n=1 Tax=Streptomyces sp. NPDC047022 TaxID=3155737 RepID=UPI003405F4EE
MKKRLLGVVGAAALLTALPLTAQPASASSTCATGAVCEWNGSNFGGAKYVLNRPTPGCYPFGGRTVSNQSTHRITLYRQPSCLGDHFDLKPGHYTSNAPWPVAAVGVWGP